MLSASFTGNNSLPAPLFPSLTLFHSLKSKSPARERGAFASRAGRLFLAEGVVAAAAGLGDAAERSPHAGLVLGASHRTELGGFRLQRVGRGPELGRVGAHFGL